MSLIWVVRRVVRPPPQRAALGRLPLLVKREADSAQHAGSTSIQCLFGTSGKWSMACHESDTAAQVVQGLWQLPALPDAVLAHVSRLLASFTALRLHHALST